jgi:hypothetical protein
MENWDLDKITNIFKTVAVILSVVAFIDVVRHVESLPKKIFYIILIFVLPIIAPIAYFICRVLRKV